MDEFFVKVNDEEKGPFTFDELTDGRLEPHDLVRTPMTGWEKASDIPDFSEYFRYEGYYFPTQDNLASFGLRLVAFLIDHVIISMFLGIGFAVFSDYLPFDVKSFDVQEPATMRFVQELYAITLVVYNIALGLSPLSSTLGQRACRLIIVDAEGNKITFLKSLIRGAGKFLSLGFYGLGFVSILFSAKRQAFHDAIAKTYVIRRDIVGYATDEENNQL